MSEETVPKRPRKLSKEVVGNQITLKVLSVDEELVYSFDQFTPDMQKKLGMYGLSQKLGDAAAGKSGEDAVAAIKKVAQGLIDNDWSIRAPAAPKVTKKDIADKMESMSDEDREAARAILAKLGISM